jgi:7-cyano-7-deazaguanine tRNA-ribosyltransferase
VFEVLRRDGLARIGRLETRHGPLETPALLPVVNPNRPTIPPREMAERFRVRALITNAYILHRGEWREKALAEGVHRLLDFGGVVMTDSGAFQQHVYGDVAVGNREIVEFQRDIGTDLGTVLDMFSEPSHDRERAASDLEETLRRTDEAAGLKGEMLLVGAVQGGRYETLREESARGLTDLAVDVSAIGGVVPLLENYRFRDLVQVILAAKRGLTPARPVHLFGAGHPMVFSLAALLGCDLFDSASYAKFAADGRLLFPDGTRHVEELEDLPCECATCHAATARELRESERLRAEHNLRVSLGEVRRVRQAIAHGDLWELAERRCRSHPALLDALRELRHHVALLERYEPTSRHAALFFTGPESAHRPAVWRFRERLKTRYRPYAETAVIFPEAERPFSRHYAQQIAATRAKSSAACLVKSVWGPVPVELDEMYPIAQSVVPRDLDAETLESTEVFFQQFVRGSGLARGIPFEDGMREGLPGPPGAEDPDLRRVRAVAGMQFGLNAADALLAGAVSIEKSPRTGKIRIVRVDGEHVLSMRAHDGLFTLKRGGARRLHRQIPPPRLRVVVDSETAEFPRQGKNVFAKFVRDADPELRPLDECLVVDESDVLLAVGQALADTGEMLASSRGVAVFVREGLDRGAGPS